MFRVGQKVVCIDDSVGNVSSKPVPFKCKEIYTVKGVYFINGIGITLVEVEDSKYSLFGAYKGNRFRSVDETFGKEVCEKVESEFLTVEV